MNKILPKNEQTFCQTFSLKMLFTQNLKKWYGRCKIDIIKKKFGMFFLVKAARVNGNLTIP